MAERRPDAADSPTGDSDPGAHKTHVFDVATALEPLEDKDGSWVFSTHVHPQFKNINDPYGGWSAAVLAQAMLQCTRPGMELVSMTTDFLSAVPDGPLHITVHSDRSGRGTEFWRAGLASARGVRGARGRRGASGGAAAGGFHALPAWCQCPGEAH